MVPASITGSAGLNGVLVIFEDRKIRVVVGVQLEKLSMNLLDGTVQLKSIAAREGLNLPFDRNFGVTIGQVISSLEVKIEVELRGSVD
jgi:hypothetical protein